MRSLKYCLTVALLLCAPSVWADAFLGRAANPQEKSTVIVQTAIPFIKAPSGTMGNNGAVSAMTALARTYSSGAYLYLPANAISAGSAAGWYWFVGSSTTAGTVYNSTYTSGIPQIGATTAFVTTGPGAFTGDTGTITSLSVTIPGNALGPSGRIVSDVLTTRNGTGGNKVLWLKYGGTACIGSTYTSQTSTTNNCTLANRGATNVQANWSGGTVNANAAIDSTVDQALIVQLNSAVATDWASLDSIQVVVTYGP